MIAVSGPLQGRSFPLRSAACIIGRQGGSDIQILDIAVSRGHCRVERGGDGSWTVHDLDSRYGTFVNGQPVRQRPLGHGDVVQVGGTSLVFLAPAGDSQRDPSQPSLVGGPLVAQSTLQRRIEDHPFAQRAVWPAPGAPGTTPVVDVARVAEERGALLRLCSTAQSARDVEALGDCVLEILRARLPSSRGAVLLASDETTRAARVEVADLRQAACAPPTSAERPVSQSILAQVLKERAAILCRDVASDAAIARAASLEDARVSSLLCAPLFAGERVLGVVYLEAERANAFEERHLDLLVAVAAIASLSLERLLQLSWLKQENRKLRGGGDGESGGLARLVGESAAMQKLRGLVRRVGATNSTVLLRGESGTGKEVCAQAIHATSGRADGPFIAINCASLSDSLLESELFGHEKGAFTGAVARKIGKVEAAHGGTLFLDELGELPLPLQARLLRVLQEREIDRVGGTKPISVDVRVVAATNRDLESAIRAGKFREDLFYRLNVVTLATPPLRERKDDILLLARTFARAAGERVGRRVVGISEAARAALVAYEWPGNVRQLGNVIERALVLGSDEVIQLEDLPDEVLAARPESAVRNPDESGRVAVAGEPALAEAASGAFHDVILATKRRLIADAYHRAGGDHPRAAALLGVHANSLHRLIRNLGLKSELGKDRE